MPKRDIAHEIITGMESAVEYMRGKKSTAIVHRVEIPDKIDVRSIRKELELSRREFAERFGFSVRTLQHWEQGDRNPHGPAKILLLLLQRKPKVIERILFNQRN